VSDVGYLHQATTRLVTATNLAASLWQARVRHYRPLIEQIIAQTERRVLAGEPVPASDTLVSLFEPHADIIRKGREVAYGHKLNTTTGRSGLILDVVIEAGNPADRERLLPMLERDTRRAAQALEKLAEHLRPKKAAAA
jgi:transposase, IS5 family